MSPHKKHCWFCSRDEGTTLAPSQNLTTLADDYCSEECALADLAVDIMECFYKGGNCSIAASLMNTPARPEHMLAEIKRTRWR